MFSEMFCTKNYTHVILFISLFLYINPQNHANQTFKPRTCIMEGCGSGGSSANSRWNPTKEQISMLESLYRQGVRTPNAEQIQQITSRLSAHGHIEGKNVFYWFQNHKARQRQKQKQETLAYVNSFLHRNPHPQPVFPPHYATQNVVCSPYYLQQCNVGLYPQYDSKLLLPGSGKRRSRTSHHEKRRNYGERIVNEEASNLDCKETLALFPLHPTEDLQGSKTTETSIDDYSAPSSSSGFKEGCSGQTFFDFFSGPCS